MASCHNAAEHQSKPSYYKYEGQEKTFHYCAESGHLVKDCPYRSRKQEVVNESWDKISGNRRSTARVTFRKLNKDEEPELYLLRNFFRSAELD
ncbi:unnamed protein product [Clavelina lepadiformis]|uniref:CCHC-type domain-containing protein n=1 Tax=Clavelina lepadiformis TaxID=159417 RepID=A0ABP0G039_CLALP